MFSVFDWIDQKDEFSIGSKISLLKIDCVLSKKYSWKQLPKIFRAFYVCGYLKWTKLVKSSYLEDLKFSLYLISCSGVILYDPFWTIWHSISMALTVYAILSYSVKFFGTIFSIYSSSESSSSPYFFSTYFGASPSPWIFTKIVAGFPVNGIRLKSFALLRLNLSSYGNSLKLKLSELFVIKRNVRIIEFFMWKSKMTFKINGDSYVIWLWCGINFSPKKQLICVCLLS